MRLFGRITLGLVLLFLTSCQRDPHIEILAPAHAPGGQPFVLTVHGAVPKDRPVIVEVNGSTKSPTNNDLTMFVVPVEPMRRGSYVVQLVAGARRSEPAQLAIDNAVPVLSVARTHLVRAGARARVDWRVRDFDGDAVTLTANRGTVVSTSSTAGFLEVQTSSSAEDTTTIDLVVSDGRDKVRESIQIEARHELPAPVITAIPVVPGNRPTSIVVTGRGFTPETQLLLNGAPLLVTVLGRTSLRAEVPARPRGQYVVKARATVDGKKVSANHALEVENSVPIVEPTTVAVDEGVAISIPIVARDPDGDAITMSAIDLMPGAYLDKARTKILFQPDFIQGGTTHFATLIATDGTSTGTAALTVTIHDTIQPPMPVVSKDVVHEDHRRITLVQTTDTYLDRADRAGRRLGATLVVPTDHEKKFPLRVYLHGFGGRPFEGGRGDQLCVYPHDPENTYWWGYQNEDGELTPYTARRVLHLVEYVLDNYDNVDPDRVYLYGSSMGGAGATTIGARFARHFSYAEATMGQMIPRRHRPLRIEQLTALWGAPSAAWDEIDVVRLLVESPEARDLFFHTRHAKDDPVIHFGAVLFRSARVRQSYYEAIQHERIGHFAAWDEGAHGPADPELGPKWWVDDWDPALDDTTFLDRRRAFVAFTNATHDDDPGAGVGDGRRAYDADQGFAGDLDVIGDQGWGGDRAGTFNRYLRWRTPTIVDSWERFTIDVMSSKPTRVDVTPRRTMRFHPHPDEPVRWRFGSQSGTAITEPDGSVTAPALEVSTWQTLIFERDIKTTGRVRTKSASAP